MAAAISTKTIAAAAATTSSPRPRPRAASFPSFRPTARLPGAVAASASRRCKAKDDTKASAAFDDDDDDAGKESSASVRSDNNSPPSDFPLLLTMQCIPRSPPLVLDVAESTWDELVLRCKAAVLVEFWAPWCGPCRLMHPIIADLAKAYTGRLRCVKLNTDKNQDVATRYSIRSIPTILIFKNGERKETVIGAVTDTTLAKTVERFL